MKTFKPRLEQLEDRNCPSATAVFSAGVLTVQGTQQSESFLVSADAAGNTHVAVNGAEISIQGTPNRANLTQVKIFGNNGADTFVTDKSLDTRDANGVLVYSPDSYFIGGNGDDTFKPQNGGIVGGLAGLTLQADGSFLVTGKVVGNNFSDGGNGNDAFISGPGNDTFLGGKGNDFYKWPPGTLTDAFQGGKGTDTALIVDGAAGNYTTHVQGNQTTINRVTGVRFEVDLVNVEAFSIQTNGVVTQV